MSQSEEYRQDHKIAKFIVCFIVVMLMTVNRHYGFLYLDVVAVVIWFFGVNPVGYVIESIRHHTHKHDKV